MSDLINKAQQIKNETQVGANSANRLGELFEDIINKIEITDVTYEELVAKINASALIPFTYYRITDFKTVHYFTTLRKGPYKVSGYASEDRWHTTIYEINEGELEPIIVFAISPNNIDGTAYSEKYPSDILRYGWDKSNFEKDISFTNYESKFIYTIDEEVTVNPDFELEFITGFKGVITKRICTINNLSANYDWRNVKFRRWKITNIDSIQSTIVGSSYLPDAYLSAINYNLELNPKVTLEVDSEDYMDFYTFDGGEANAENVKILKQASVRPSSETDPYNGWVGSILPNVVFRYDTNYKRFMSNVVVSNIMSDGNLMSTFGYSEGITFKSFMSIVGGWGYGEFKDSQLTCHKSLLCFCSIYAPATVKESAIEYFIPQGITMIYNSYIYNYASEGVYSYVLSLATNTYAFTNCSVIGHMYGSGTSFIDLDSLPRVNDRTSYVFYRTNTNDGTLRYKGVYFTHDTNEMVVENVPRIA